MADSATEPKARTGSVQSIERAFSPLELMADAGGKATVSMHGTATDSQSGMVGGHAGVAWALAPGGSRTPAQAVAGNDFGAWRADVALTGTTT